MPETLIRPFEERDLREVRSIFFESSTKKEFKDQAERDAFEWKYLGFYLAHYPELAWVAAGEKVLGYCIAASVSDTPELYAIQPHLRVFAEHFSAYPAHLHINLSSEARGQGLGGKLIEACSKALKERSCSGLHIMTAPDARNRHFYLRLGFQFQTELAFKGSPILFMGKKL